MKLVVNGKTQNTEENSLSVMELIKMNNVKMPDMVTVRLNKKFVDKSKYSETYLSENDKIDFLYFMGGGSRKKGIAV
ncbi:MAG: sulfur carrier protein ThiS [Spirochaetes bacterium]|nr:sulfur carrier protein ThiS [Spirochaetota bacterium]